MQGLSGYGPSVLLDAAQFRAWVTHFNWEDPDSIGRATSADGQTWTGHAQAIADGHHPSVLKEGTGFGMWYGSGGTRHATSPDGLTWTVDPTPPFTGGGFPTVIFDEGIYKMWFVRPWDGIFYATSTDGRTWIEHGLSLPNGPADAWDATVSDDDDHIAPSAIGYATYP